MFIIISSSSAFAEKGSIDCKPINDPQYDFILDCFDKIDVRTSTLGQIYKDFNSFSKSFQGAKVYDIREEGSFTYAKLEIPTTITIKSDIRFSSSTNYVLEFIDGHLRGSKLTISLEKIPGFYDGTKDGASQVNLYFQIKNKPCTGWGLFCANFSHFEFALDRGLDLIESEAKKLQEKIDAQKKADEKIKLSSTTKITPTKITPTKITPTKTTTETKPKVETELRGPPVVDSDGDGISDAFDKCKFDKETYNGYLDYDGCPDKVPQASKPQVTDYDGDGIIDSKDSCKFAKETYNGYLDYDGCPDKVPQATIPIAPTTVQAIKKELPSTFSVFRVERGEYTISKYSTTEVSIMGKIEGPGRGESIELMIKRPDGSVEKVNSLIAGSGNFGNVIVLDGKSPPGLYSVVARNENKLSETISFQVTRFEDVTKESTFEDVAKESTFPIIITQKLPNWIKTNAGWWVDGHIDNGDFAKGIEYMVKQKIIQVHEIKTTVKPNLLIDEIPGWVKTNAKWWVQGHITDEEFRQTIEYLIKEGVIRT